MRRPFVAELMVKALQTTTRGGDACEHVAHCLVAGPRSVSRWLVVARVWCWLVVVMVAAAVVVGGGCLLGRAKLSVFCARVVLAALFRAIQAEAHQAWRAGEVRGTGSPCNVCCESVR